MCDFHGFRVASGLPALRRICNLLRRNFRWIRRHLEIEPLVKGAPGKTTQPEDRFVFDCSDCDDVTFDSLRDFNRIEGDVFDMVKFYTLVSSVTYYSYLPLIMELCSSCDCLRFLPVS